jgi:hypothetical protein
MNELRLRDDILDELAYEPSLMPLISVSPLTRTS